MPETAVNKDCGFSSGQNNIRLSDNMVILKTTTKTQPIKHVSYSAFYGGVRSANSLHALACLYVGFPLDWRLVGHVTRILSPDYS
jgi:hypothetical protein